MIIKYLYIRHLFLQAPGNVDLRHIYSIIYPTEIDGGLKWIVEEKSLGIKIIKTCGGIMAMRWAAGAEIG
jgi:hypothetical protein